MLDLGAIITGLRDLLCTSIGAGIEVCVAPVADRGTVLADRGQLEQVVLNLAVNARDAMPQGGTLTIATGVTELDSQYTRLHPGVRPGRYAELTVSDTGTGIPADVAARIFEPFYTTKPRGRGTGLGLLTVYGIVTQAGGSVGVNSAAGMGTTFRIYLPCAGEPASAAQRQAAPGAGGQGDTVLIVDDEPVMLEVASRILRKDGYATLEAGTCEEALALASSADFQLLLADSVMPGMSGPTLAEHIARTRPGLPVLHMSGNSAGVLSQDRIRDAELAFVQKPFTAHDLLAKVRAALDPSMITVNICQMTPDIDRDHGAVAGLAVALAVDQGDQPEHPVQVLVAALERGEVRQRPHPLAGDRLGPGELPEAVRTVNAAEP